ncbi:hypothetical protein C8R44DRAFT_735624 [Mycena epipterygia]|nr:hypothetical protein C8R44DRAFT_735624 [Mycena epipterygia]
MDSYFKIQQAKEEIQQLNIEIHWIVMHHKHEKEFLMKKEAELALVEPTLALFVQRYQHQREPWYQVLDLVDEDSNNNEDVGEIAQGKELSEVMEGVAMLPVDKDE